MQINTNGIINNKDYNDVVKRALTRGILSEEFIQDDYKSSLLNMEIKKSVGDIVDLRLSKLLATSSDEIKEKIHNLIEIYNKYLDVEDIDKIAFSGIGLDFDVVLNKLISTNNPQFIKSLKDDSSELFWSKNLQAMSIHNIPTEVMNALELKLKVLFKLRYADTLVESKYDNIFYSELNYHPAIGLGQFNNLTQNLKGYRNIQLNPSLLSSVEGVNGELESVILNNYGIVVKVTPKNKDYIIDFTNIFDADVEFCFVNNNVNIISQLTKEQSNLFISNDRLDFVGSKVQILSRIINGHSPYNIYRYLNNLNSKMFQQKFNSEGGQIEGLNYHSNKEIKVTYVGIYTLNFGVLSLDVAEESIFGSDYSNVYTKPLDVFTCTYLENNFNLKVGYEEELANKRKIYFESLQKSFDDIIAYASSKNIKLDTTNWDKKRNEIYIAKVTFDKLKKLPIEEVLKLVTEEHKHKLPKCAELLNSLDNLTYDELDSLEEKIRSTLFKLKYINLKKELKDIAKSTNHILYGITWKESVENLGFLVKTTKNIKEYESFIASL